MRKAAILTIIAALILVSQPVFAAPFVYGRGAVIMDLKTGQMLWSQNADEKLYPASTTKILTALIVIERTKLTDIVTVSKNAYGVEGTSVYLNEGEKETVEDLLYALLLPSANDAAVALAEHVAGSVDAFAKLMNEKAVELGATHSHFVNPHGLHDPDHYTTPGDLALIAKGAMANPTFRRFVQTEQKNIPWPGQPWPRALYNQNKLLTTYDGMIGVKNGYTDEAMQTFVGAAQRQDHEILTVIMKTDHIWDDTRALLDYGFQIVETRQAVIKGTRYQVGDYIFNIDQSLNYDTAKGLTPNIVLRFQPPAGKSLTDLRTGNADARLDAFVEGTLIGSVPLTLVERPTTSWVYQWWIWLIICFFVLRIRVMIRRARRRRQQSTPIRIAKSYGSGNFRL